MTQSLISRRQFVSGTLLALGSGTLPACGGGAVDATAAAVASQTGAKSQTSSQAPAGGRYLTSIRVSASAPGTALPYVATVLPLEGQVPRGAVLVSPDDARLDASVLSRWTDGSAAVVVVAGSVNAASATVQTLRLNVLTTGVPAAAPALTVARIGAVLNAVVVDFGALGQAQLRDFSQPERLWWANAQTLCARYRAAAPGHATLEALVDVQVFSGGRARVEIVVENARMDSAAPVRPLDASYLATVSVNGLPVASVDSGGSPEGVHSAFRAWYATTWVGGDPGLRAAQLHTDLQQHPLLFRVDQPGVDLSGYAADQYTAWAPARHRATYMGSTGDAPDIGPLPLWEAQFLQTGDGLAAHAVEVNALAVLGYNVGYRDAITGLVPHAGQLVGKDQHYNWPGTGNPDERMTWEVAHHPAAGFMAFVCRPSPIFIEIAQRIVVKNCTWSTGGVGGQNLGAWSGTGITDSTGIYGYWYQERGRAWGIRSLVHATFLSPDGSDWRNGGKTWLDMNRIYLAEWMKNPAARALNVFWDQGPNDAASHGGPGSPWLIATWETHFLVGELHRAASARLLAAGPQAALDALADWATMLPVRWVNEQPNGGWRYIPYTQAIADAVNTLPPAADWGQVVAHFVTDVPPSVAGPLSVLDGPTSNYALYGTNGLAGAYYPSYWWAALVAGVERNVPGAATAWATVQANTTNLATWRTGFAANPRWGATPRRINGTAV
jgi:hypothetical protein